eukprot:TRINITY_DN2545_c0_g1_i4.p1 TRINITY_DN2545_c0_g1~~TRINITY_DN2545_c0_g1_i4.p1  ORF type:complete len:314 (+),score=35.78 TRINITY_DN2545_c0_g1_i4:735-1676(+)
MNFSRHFLFTLAPNLLHLETYLRHDDPPVFLKNYPDLKTYKYLHQDNHYNNLKYIYKNCRDIETIYCEFLSDHEMNLLIENCTELKSLSICGSGVTDNTMYDLGMKLPNLEHLDISNCVNLSPDGIVQMIKRCQSLKSIDISYTNADDRTMFALSKITELDTLRVMECDNITDEGYLSISTHCKKISTISISGDSFTHLKEMKSLINLSITCSPISETDLCAILSNNKIKSLYIDQCNKINYNNLFTEGKQYLRGILKVGIHSNEEPFPVDHDYSEVFTYTRELHLNFICMTQGDIQLLHSCRYLDTLNGIGQ